MIKIHIKEEFKSTEDIVNALFHIEELLEAGYTAGHNPNWVIEELNPDPFTS